MRKVRKSILKAAVVELIIVIAIIAVFGSIVELARDAVDKSKEPYPVPTSTDCSVYQEPSLPLTISGNTL